MLACLFAASPSLAQKKSDAQTTKKTTGKAEPPAKTPAKTPTKTPAKAESKKSAQNTQSASDSKAPAKTAASEAAAIEREMERTRGALASVKAELEKGRARYRELQNEEGNYLGRLEQLEKNISASGRYMEMVQSRIDSTEKTLAHLGDSLTKAEVDLKNARELMKRRLRNAQMMGETNMLQMLATAQSPTEFIRRVRYFQDINAYDKRLTETIKTNITSVNRRRTAQEEHKAALVVLLDEKKKEQQALVEEEASRRVVLEDIRNKKEAFAAMVAEYEESQRELDALMQVLEDRRRKAAEEEERRKKAVKEKEKEPVTAKPVVKFEKLMGKLPWPVKGEVITSYGRVVHPVYRTVIMNNGIDIAAKKGTAVRNVAPGTVAHVNSMRGLGRFVIVDHNDGYMTIYGNLDAVSVKLDQELAVGATIGTVGETGTAGGPKLHFEVRKSAETLDPQLWLEK